MLLGPCNCFPEEGVLQKNKLQGLNKFVKLNNSYIRGENSHM